MNLYKVEYGVTEFGADLVRVKWVGTQAEAARVKKQLTATSAYDIEVEACEVPTDKPGLLAWLNRNVAGDE
jgi:hypothetical protein